MTPGDGRPTDPGSEAGLREVLERFRIGWERQDAHQVLSTMSQRDCTVVYGTDLDERWIGYESLVEPFNAMVKAINDPAYGWGKDEPRIRIKGEVGWACGNLAVTFMEHGTARTMVMRATFVAEAGKDGWKIVHAHFSIGQDDAVVVY